MRLQPHWLYCLNQQNTSESEGSKLDEAIEVVEAVEELQNLLKGAKNTAGQQTAVEGKTKQ